MLTKKDFNFFELTLFFYSKKEIINGKKNKIRTNIIVFLVVVGFLFFTHAKGNKITPQIKKIMIEIGE